MKRVRYITFTAFLGIAIATCSLAHVTLLNPLGGESFHSGDTVTIFWQLDQSHEQLSWEIYFSPDGGETWEALASLPVDRYEYEWIVPKLDTEEGIIRILQDNEMEDYDDYSEVFRISAEVVVTGLNDYSDFEDLAQYAVYPNPFNTSPSIEFSLVSTVKVSVAIYDLQGTRVYTLFDGLLTPGSYSGQWPADGSPPGLYLCYLQVGDKAKTLRLIKIL